MRNLVKILVVVGIIGLMAGCDCGSKSGLTTATEQNQINLDMCRNAGGLPSYRAGGWYAGCDFPPAKQ